METKKGEFGQEWEIWTLSEGDIKETCEREGISYESLTDDDKHEIAHKFENAFGFGVEGWDNWLAEVMSAHLKEKIAVKNV